MSILNFILFTSMIPCLLFGDRQEALIRGLKEYYHIENEPSEQIVEIFQPLLNDPQYGKVIDNFLSQSKSLQIDFSSNTSGILPKNDPVLIAPCEHCIVYENDHVRVLLGDLQPHQLEKAHQHFWKRILVIIQGAKFKISTPTSEIIDEWPPGSYLLEPETESFSTLNLSDHPYRGITFEVKE